MYSRTEYFLTEDILNKYGFAFIERKEVCNNVDDIEGFKEKEYVDIYKSYTYSYITGMYKYVIYIYYIEVDGVLNQKLEKTIEMYKVNIESYSQELYKKDTFFSFEDYFIENGGDFKGYVFRFYGSNYISFGDYVMFFSQYDGYFVMFFSTIYAKTYFDTYLFGYIAPYKKTRFIIMEIFDSWSFTMDIDEDDRIFNIRNMMDYFYKISCVDHLVETDNYSDLTRVFYFFKKAIKRFLTKKGKEKDFEKYFIDIECEEAYPETIFKPIYKNFLEVKI